MVDVHSKLDELTETVAGAKSVPLSASCVVHRTELLAAIDEVRQLLPTELAAAGDLLRDKQDVVAEGQAEAARIVEAATAERARLVSETEVFQEAERKAAEVLSDAHEQAATMRREVENYVDGKLANFEVVLQKTVAAVSRGREKLRGAADDELAGDEPVLVGADSDAPRPRAAGNPADTRG
jgi:hypothetical protein